jgi:CysZ protein
MVQDLPRAFAQLSDWRCLRVMLIGLIGVLPLFALLYWGLDHVLSGWTRSLAADFDQALGWRRWLGGAIRALDEVIALVATVASLWFLFPPLATTVMGALLDDVVDAVEDRHYPSTRAPHPLGFWRGLRLGAGSAMRILVWNLAFSPLYVALLLTAIGPAFLFLAVNAVLLGREYVEMVMARHVPKDQLNAVLKAKRPAILGVGFIASAFFLIPIVNLAAPIVGAALATHAAHRALGHVPR